MRQTISCPTNRTSCTLLILQWQIPLHAFSFSNNTNICHHFVFIDFGLSEYSYSKGIMKTFIAEFALICCSQLKLCQSKVFNIKYDEFPWALIVQHHPTQGDSCHWSTGALGWEVLPRALPTCWPEQEIIIHFVSDEIIPFTSMLNSVLGYFPSCCCHYYEDFSRVFLMYPFILWAKVALSHKRLPLMTSLKLSSVILSFAFSPVLREFR